MIFTNIEIFDIFEIVKCLYTFLKKIKNKTMILYTSFYFPKVLFSYEHTV